MIEGEAMDRVVGGLNGREQCRLRVAGGIAFINVTHGFHGDAAGFLAAFVSAHAIGNDRKPPLLVELFVGIRLPIDKGILIVGALLRVIFEPFLPNKIVAGADGGLPAEIPLLEGRAARSGRATAYVCEHYVCQAPTSDPDELRAQLKV